jgi:hypothetical protein
VTASTSGNDEDTTPALGNSEETAVQHSPGEVVKPELGQRREYDGEIASVVAGKKSGNVLKEEPATGPHNVVGNSGEVEEKARPLAFDDARAAPGDGEVLAGASSAEEIDGNSVSGSHVVEAGDGRPVAGEDFAARFVFLALEDDAHSGALKSEVEASDP